MNSTIFSVRVRLKEWRDGYSMFLGSILERIYPWWYLVQKVWNSSRIKIQRELYYRYRSQYTDRNPYIYNFLRLPKLRPGWWTNMRQLNCLKNIFYIGNTAKINGWKSCHRERYPNMCLFEIDWLKHLSDVALILLPIAACPYSGLFVASITWSWNRLKHECSVRGRPSLSAFVPKFLLAPNFGSYPLCQINEPIFLSPGVINQRR